MRLDRFPSSAGIGPVKSLFWRFNHVRLDRFPSSAGIGPVKLLCWRDSTVTRPLSSVLTPCHSPSGAPVFHFVLCVHKA